METAVFRPAPSLTNGVQERELSRIKVRYTAAGLSTTTMDGPSGFSLCVVAPCDNDVSVIERFLSATRSAAVQR